jgi:transcriptional regulator CtsR
MHMPSLSDLIEGMIKQMIEENDGRLETTRNELAVRVHCVPSQISYVLTTRFGNGQGYYVESRRGGGGWIRIRRVTESDPAAFLWHVLNASGNRLSSHGAQVLIEHLSDHRVLDPTTTRLVSAALSDQALGEVPPEVRDVVRMDLMKYMLTSLYVT